MICLAVEKLTFFNFFFFVFPHIVSLKSANSVQKIRVGFIDASFLGRVCAQWVLPLFSIPMARIEFNLLDLRDDKGDLIYLKVLYNDLLQIQQQICQDRFFTEVLHAPCNYKYFYSYLKKSAISQVWYDSMTLCRLLMVIQVSSWWSYKQQQGVKSCVVFADPRIWIQSLKGYLEKYRVQLKSSHRVHINYKRMIKAVIGERNIKRLYVLWYGSKKADLHTEAGKDKCQGKLVLEYYGSFNLDNPQYYSDFAFWQQSSFSAQNILIASNMTGAPLNKEQGQLLQAQGIEAIALHPKATTKDGIPVYCGKEEESKPRALPFKEHGGYHRESKWVRQSMDDFHGTVEYYRSFFERFNAKIYLSWFKYNAHHIAVAEAIASVGGVMAIYQRAMEQESNPETAVICDVFFGFSAKGAEIERQSGSKISYYVVTGYLGDHRFALLKEPALCLRKKLMAAGARKIIAFFDENSGDDPRWHTGHEFMRQNYAFILEKILNESYLGLIIKPKIPLTLRKRLGQYLPLLEKALATGRCFIYDQANLFSTYPPAIAALSADIIIHGHLCAATAGLESALAGVPTLLLDREGWQDCHLYCLGEGKVVFRSWEDAWQACQEHWRRPSGIDGFGDWSEFLREFDPFRDGKASERMGEYLKWLMQGFEDRLPREQILSQAAKRYADRWGKNKIIGV